MVTSQPVVTGICWQLYQLFSLTLSTEISIHTEDLSSASCQLCVAHTHTVRLQETLQTATREHKDVHTY